MQDKTIDALNRVCRTCCAINNCFRDSTGKIGELNHFNIDEALDESKNGHGYTREEVMKEARQKYPDLNFR